MEGRGGGEEEEDREDREEGEGRKGGREEGRQRERERDRQTETDRQAERSTGRTDNVFDLVFSLYLRVLIFLHVVLGRACSFPLHVARVRNRADSAFLESFFCHFLVIFSPDFQVHKKRYL